MIRPTGELRLQIKNYVSLTYCTGFIAHLAYTAVLAAERHSPWAACLVNTIHSRVTIYITPYDFLRLTK